VSILDPAVLGPLAALGGAALAAAGSYARARLVARRTETIAVERTTVAREQGAAAVVPAVLAALEEMRGELRSARIEARAALDATAECERRHHESHIEHARARRADSEACARMLEQRVGEVRDEGRSAIERLREDVRRVAQRVSEQLSAMPGVRESTGLHELERIGRSTPPEMLPPPRREER
jgi:hypothetical protein